MSSWLTSILWGSKAAPKEQQQPAASSSSTTAFDGVAPPPVPVLREEPVAESHASSQSKRSAGDPETVADLKDALDCDSLDSFMDEDSESFSPLSPDRGNEPGATAGEPVGLTDADVPERAAAADKAQAERVAAEKAAAEKAAAEKAAAEKAEAERIAAEKAEAERAAAEKAEAERIAAEKAEAERVAAEKAEAERVAAEKAEAERVAAEKAEAERVAAAEKAEAERIAAEKVEAERVAAEKAEAERVAAAEKAEAERVAAEKAEAERVAAAEKAEAERVAAEKAEAERVAAEKAEAERIAAEKAAAAAEREAIVRAAILEGELRGKEALQKAEKERAFGCTREAAYVSCFFNAYAPDGLLSGSMQRVLVEKLAGIRKDDAILNAALVAFEAANLESFATEVAFLAFVRANGAMFSISQSMLDILLRELWGDSCGTLSSAVKRCCTDRCAKCAAVRAQVAPFAHKSLAFLHMGDQPVVHVTKMTQVARAFGVTLSHNSVLELLNVSLKEREVMLEEFAFCIAHELFAAP